MEWDTIRVKLYPNIRLDLQLLIERVNYPAISPSSLPILREENRSERSANANLPESWLVLSLLYLDRALRTEGEKRYRREREGWWGGEKRHLSFSHWPRFSHFRRLRDDWGRVRPENISSQKNLHNETFWWQRLTFSQLKIYFFNSIDNKKECVANSPIHLNVLRYFTRLKTLEDFKQNFH